MRIWFRLRIVMARFRATLRGWVCWRLGHQEESTAKIWVHRDWHVGTWCDYCKTWSVEPRAQ